MRPDVSQVNKSHRPNYKDGEQMRDFLYVKDAIHMTLHLAETPTAGGIFNLGSGKAHTWIELATAIFTALGKEPNIEFIDMPEHLQSKYQYYTCADITKLRGSGFSTEITPLAEAMRDYTAARHKLSFLHGALLKICDARQYMCRATSFRTSGWVMRKSNLWPSP